MSSVIILQKSNDRKKKRTFSFNSNILKLDNASVTFFNITSNDCDEINATRFKARTILILLYNTEY